MTGYGLSKKQAIGLYAVVAVVLYGVIFFVPITTEETIVQCIRAPCPPIIESKSLYDLLYKQSKDEFIACTLEYAPVCGDDGKTHSNACFAGAEGAKILHQGECTGDEEISMKEPSVFCRIYPSSSGC